MKHLIDSIILILFIYLIIFTSWSTIATGIFMFLIITGFFDNLIIKIFENGGGGIDGMPF